ncbi:unnamed protein product, partial [Polarella glacialis]
VPPHPPCEFCNDRLYNDDALLTHMHKKHHLCSLCDRNGRKNEFFANWRCLALHYQEKHHVCAHKDCMRGGHRLIAFADEEELSIHYYAEHQDASRLAAGGKVKLQVGQTSYADEVQARENRATGSKGKGRGKGSGSALAQIAPVRFSWPSTATKADWALDGANNSEELGRDSESDGEGERYPVREVVPAESRRGPVTEASQQEE